jgi:hypothetical protein
MNFIKLSSGNCFQHHHWIWSTEFAAKTIPARVARFHLQKRTWSAVPNLSVRIKAVKCRSDATLVNKSKLLCTACFGRHRASLTSVTQHYSSNIRIENQNFPLVLYKSLFWCSPSRHLTRRRARDRFSKDRYIYTETLDLLYSHNGQWCYL